MNKLKKPEQQVPIRNSRYAGRRLWYARRYLGYSRELVAVELGIEASELKEIELGLRDVGNDIFTKCSNLYGRQADWLSKDAKPDESDLKSMNTIPPWRFAQKDWKEFKIFRYVSDKLSKKPLLSKTVSELGAVLSKNGCSEEFHQALNTYSSSMKTGNVDIINAISQIGVFTILRPIGILGAIMMKGHHTGLMLSESGVKSELRHAAAIALRMLVATYLKNSWSEDNVWFWLSQDQLELDISERKLISAVDILLPKYLFANLQTRLKWSNRDLSNPVNMYQASLRLGASYQTTVKAYTLMGTISQCDCQNLLKLNIGEVKRLMLEGRVPDNIDKIDVWALSQREEGTFINAKADDIFVIKLLENASAGYRWKFDELEENGFVILGDDYTIDNSGQIGGPSLRTVQAQPYKVADRKIELVETCPWRRLPTKKNKFSFTYQRPVERKIGLIESELH